MYAVSLVKDDKISWALPNAESNVTNCLDKCVLFVSLPVLATVVCLATVLELKAHLISRGLNLKVLRK